MNTNSDQEHLWKLLEEDTGSPAQADALLPTLQALVSWHPPPVSAESTDRLLTALNVEMGTLSTADRSAVRVDPLLLMRAQRRIVQGEIWLASALVLGLGILVTLVLLKARPGAAELPIVLVAPLVAAFGLAFLYSADIGAALEIEHATPVSPALVMLARVTLVFGFDLIIGLAGSFLIALVQPSISVWPLVSAWLAPMAFLSALAFLSSVVFVDALLGALVSFMLWVGLIVARLWHSAPFGLAPNLLPDLLAVSARPWLVVLALPLFAVGLWLSGRRELYGRGTSW